MYWDDISILHRYVQERYPYPIIFWRKKKKQFEMRCYETYICERVIMTCMDRPMKDPIDIIQDIWIELEISLRFVRDNQQQSDIYHSMKYVVRKLYNYMNNFRKGGK